MTPSTHVADVRLHDYLDGELPDADARLLEDHVAGCPRCAERLADFAEVRTALGALPRSGAPPRDLWPGIERHLDPSRATRILSLHGPAGVEGGAGDPRESEPDRTGTPARRSTGGAPRSVAYAAGLVLAFAAGALAWRGATNGPAAPPGTGAVAENVVAQAVSDGSEFAASVEVRAAITDLEAILAAGRDRLDPATLDVLDGSLAAIDTAIAEAEAALARDPASALLQDLLLAQERVKVRVLTRAATRLLPST